jgi:hypothetical protein
MRAYPIAIRFLFAALLAWLLMGQNAFAQQAPSACTVSYTPAWSGGNGFGANVTITNTGTAAITNWSMVFTFPSGQTISNGWPVSVSQSGTQVTVASNAPWNATLNPNAPMQVGFNATHTGTNTPPSTFTLNGTVCNGGGNQQPGAPVVSLTSPTTGQSFAAGAAVPRSEERRGGKEWPSQGRT